MKMLHTLIPVAALVAAPAVAQPMAPAEFVAAAGASDLYEKQSSELVLQTKTDPAIRSYARMMIDHHAKSTADVTAAAKRTDLTPAQPQLTPAQTELIAQLRAEQGAARDKAYVAQQKASHQQALAVHQAYAREGTAAPLKTAAGRIVPVVQRHVAMLMKM